MTRTVRRITVSRVGQATFFSSAQLSTRYRRTPVNTMSSFFLLLRVDRVLCSRGGRGDRTRTCNRWFWRPVLYQLSYTPIEHAALLRLPVQLVLPAAGAELVQLHPPRVVPLVLPGAVRALLADGARQGDHRSILGFCHVKSVLRQRPPSMNRGHAETGPGNRGKRRDLTAIDGSASTSARQPAACSLFSRRRRTMWVNGSRTSLNTSMLTRKPRKMRTTPSSSPIKNDHVTPNRLRPLVQPGMKPPSAMSRVA